VTRLPERQRAVLVARYGLDGLSPESLQVVADRLALSREDVRPLQERTEESLTCGRGLSRAS
jgi:DNA-directed RNA polymerase sigma subunit (sigma70/sigma32)